MSIDIKNLSFSYGKIEVLKGINFKASNGQLVSVLGANGAGKSTMFRCILKFLKEYSGEIYLDGTDIKMISTTELAKKIAYIPQNASPVFNYTVRDIVLMGTTADLSLLKMPGKAQLEKVNNTLKMLGIEHLAQRGIKKISGGERQLAMIARAIVQNAHIIIMDEPTANLDYGNQIRVMEIIRNLANDGYMIIMSTHNPDQALIFSDTAFILKDGQVLDSGAVNTVITDEIMQQLYDVNVRIYEHCFDGKTIRACIPVSTNTKTRIGI